MPRSSFFLAFLAASAVSAARSSGCWRDTPCTGPTDAAFSGPWDSYIYSPGSRVVSPIQILNGDQKFLSKYPHHSVISGNGSMVIYDFGKEVGGVTTVQYTAAGSGQLGLAWTEAKNWTGTSSDESNGGGGPDGALYADIVSTSDGSYTVPDAQLRGGFRYLTLFALTDSSLALNITAINLEISYQPTWSNLRAYGGYFYSSDHLLNRIWYAGAYTIQTDTVPPTTGRVYPCLNQGWANDADLGTAGTAVIVDGAKRDRAVWAGDLGIAVRSALVSIGDLDSVKNALQVQYTYQNSDTGELPMVGPPINFFGSDTYHMATLIGTYDYVLFSGDLNFLNSNWAKYQLAMSFITSKIDSTGMIDITGASNWGRGAASSGHATDGNMLLYRVLTTGSILAEWQGSTDLVSHYQSLAETLKTAVNQQNWDSTIGAFKNTDTDASVHPEDGNSMALYYNGTTNSTIAVAVSKYLTTNWGPIGAITPELPGNIVPYVESFEVKGHFAVQQTQRALDLIRLSWGWYLNNPFGTGSTTIEGYYEDGSFNYQNDGYDRVGSYPSHAHGWSTGPTDALTSYVIGLGLTAPGGQQWLLAPQFGDLTFAEGGFTTPLGQFSAGWTEGSGETYTITYDVPDGTTGSVQVPFSSSGKQPREVLLDGRRTPLTVEYADGQVVVPVKGGKHQIRIAY